MQVKMGVANGTKPTMKQEPDPQVLPKAERRRFSAEYKLRIVTEADGCIEHGQIGGLLRREGLYSSHLTKWRRQRDEGTLGQKRGRKPDPQAAEVKRLQRENEQLRARLERAEHIIDVQKKLAQLLGTSLDETPGSESL
jgi:transposase-like protein